VRLIGTGTTGASGSRFAPDFIILELCEGGSLGDLLDRAPLARAHSRTLFQTSDALRWATQLAGALEYLHSRDPQVCVGER
jgi:serine/threonine protein kinase